MRLVLILLCLVLLAVPLPSLGQEDGAEGGTSPAQLQETIRLEQERATQRQEEVQELQRTEESLRRELSRIEQRIAGLQQRIAEQERTLDEIRAEERATQDEYIVLRDERDKFIGELRGLLRAIWPVHMQSLQSRFAGVQSWDEADRRYTWLSDIYGATREKLDQAQAAADRVEANLNRQRELAAEAEAQLSRVNALKDDLLRDKLALRRRLGNVHEERVDLEQELQAILGAIQDLNYQLDLHRTRKITLHQHALPWPVQGSVFSTFNEGADPPRRGLGISVDEGATVRSVFWGKVVHADTLRGFGRVVIVYHGYDYYSLYAYLADTTVQAGQEVEKDEPLGHAGYYPDAGGPGLYFELRFRQKPINPQLWLTSAP